MRLNLVGMLSSALGRAPRFGFVLYLLALLVCGCACVAGAMSVGWRLAHDAPVVLYPTYLAWTGEKIPYRTVFDFNFPGTYIVYGMLGAVTGLEPIKLQLVDLALLILGAVIFAYVFPSGMRLAALTGYSGFVCLYLGWYSEFGLQRELFCTLVGAGACLVALRGKSAVWIGVLGGISVLIKPTTLIAFGWVLFWVALQERSWVVRCRIGAFWVLGFAVPILAICLWLAKLGALGDFISIARNYTPLYGTMDGAHRTLHGVSRVTYDVQHMLWPIAAVRWTVIGVVAVLALSWSQLGEEHGLKRTIVLLAGTAVAFYVYPVFTGQFWRYHYLPFFAFSAVLLASGFACVGKAPKLLWQERAALAASCVALMWLFARTFDAVGGYTKLPTQKVSEQVRAYLMPRLGPTDTVQPLDWTGGLVGGMLECRAHLATSFVYDFEFYHSVSNPVIQGLRRRFIRELTLAKPKYILERLGEEKPWPRGEDTTRRFPELAQLMARDYLVAARFSSFHVWVKKG